MEIKNVIICGLGALGLTYANKLKDICNLKILVDENGVRYMITGSKEKHERVYKTEKDTVIASLKHDIKCHLDYVEWLKQQLKIWQEKQ